MTNLETKKVISVESLLKAYKGLIFKEERNEKYAVFEKDFNDNWRVFVLLGELTKEEFLSKKEKLKLEMEKYEYLERKIDLLPLGEVSLEELLESNFTIFNPCFCNDSCSCETEKEKSFVEIENLSLGFNSSAYREFKKELREKEIFAIYNDL